MNKREFIEKLRELLSFELPERLIEKHVSYYSSYIDEQKSSGRPEAEVLAELGDPQLIARSIIDAERSGSDGIPHTDDDRDYSGEIYGQKTGSGGYRETAGEEQTRYGGADNGRVAVFNGGCFTVILIVIAVLFILISLLGFLAPYLAGLAVVMCIMWLIRRIGGGI